MISYGVFEYFIKIVVSGSGLNVGGEILPVEPIPVVFLLPDTTIQNVSMSLHNQIDVISIGVKNNS